MSEIERLGNLILSNGGDSRVRVSRLVRLVPEEDRTSSFKQYTLKLQNGTSVRVFHAPDFSRATGWRLSERVFIAKTKGGFNDLAFFLLRSTQAGVYFRADPCFAKVAMNLAGGDYYAEADRKRAIGRIVSAITAAEREAGPNQPRSKKAQAIIDTLRARHVLTNASQAAEVIEQAPTVDRTWKILVLHPETFETVGTVKELFKSKEAVLSKMAELAKLRPEAVFVKAELQERVRAKMALVWG